MNNCQQVTPVIQREIPELVAETRGWLDNLEGAIGLLAGKIAPISSPAPEEARAEIAKTSTQLGGELVAIVSRIESATKAIRRLAAGVEL